MDSYSVSKFFVKNVLCNDEIYVALTHKLGSRRYRRFRGRPLAEMQKWKARGLLSSEEQDYLELFLVWKSRLDHLRIDYFSSCFSL